MDALDTKLNETFQGCVVRKDLLHKIKKGTNVPSFVLEFLLARYCATDDPAEIQDGIEAVVETLQKNYVRPDEANIAQSRVQQKGKHKFIDKISVSYVEKEKRHWAAMANFGSSRVAIPDKYYRDNERLLEGGIWAEVTVAHNDVDEDDYAFYVEDLRPIQLSKFDFEAFCEGRQRFTRDEWLDVLVRSVGLEPSKMTMRIKFHFLCRLFPFVESNYNFIELGPRGTGKSYVFSEFSPYATLLSGGQASTPTLFYNNQRRKVGLVGFWDVIAFDEVGGARIKDPNTIDIMKDYMANGRFSRGADVIADASFAFVGNIDHSIEQLVNSAQFDLFEPLDQSFNLAIQDRFHSYLPGWEIPKNTSALLTSSYGFITDYLAEALHYLSKKVNRYEYVSSQCKFGSTLQGRDEAAIKKTVCALMKLLHPGGEPTPSELSEYMAYAVEGRRRVKEQMNKRKADDEFGLINLSYFDDQNQEVIVFCPESKNAEATQNPERKSLPGAISRNKGKPLATVVTGVRPSAAPVSAVAEGESAIHLPQGAPISEIIGTGESSTVEFKSSLRMNLHTKNSDQKIEHAVLKTLAAFLNTHGGTLVVGVDDKGTPLGLENDGFQNEDKMDQHLANLIRDRLGPQHTLCLHPQFEDYEGRRILVVRCDSAKSPAYLKDGKTEYFYIRTSGTTSELPASKIHDYVRQRFGG
jgi:ATP-dependent Lon protease